MAESLELDSINGRLHVMWEEGGIQYRSNLVICEGGGIELHSHWFPHTTLIPFGWFKGREIAPDGTVREFQLASRGYKPSRTDIPFEPIGYRFLNQAGYKHEFTLLELQDQPGEVLCIIAMENMK